MLALKKNPFIYLQNLPGQSRISCKDMTDIPCPARAYAETYLNELDPPWLQASMQRH